jgi:hypothetical protein
MSVGSIVEQSPDLMTEADWQVAHAIAQTLVKQETDVNEVGKAIAYLRNAVNQHPSDAGTRFFQYLETLVNHGRTIGHSDRTLDYYRTIEQTCKVYLFPYQSKPNRMLYLLGWVARLMRYYREAGAIGKDLGTLAKPAQTTSVATIESERQAKYSAIAETQNFQVGQRIEAEVKTIKGKEVTYELPGRIKLTIKEPKKYETLSKLVGKTVQVEILELRETGIPKRVKCVD